MSVKKVHFFLNVEQGSQIFLEQPQRVYLFNSQHNIKKVPYSSRKILLHNHIILSRNSHQRLHMLFFFWQCCLNLDFYFWQPQCNVDTNICSLFRDHWPCPWSSRNDVTLSGVDPENVIMTT
jgi:hypothetical protein